MLKCFPLLLWVMVVVTNDSALVFSLVFVCDCIVLGDLSVQSTAAQLRLIFTPHTLQLMPNRFALMV